MAEEEEGVALDVAENVEELEPTDIALPGAPEDGPNFLVNLLDEEEIYVKSDSQFVPGSEEQRGTACMCDYNSVYPVRS